MTIAHALAPSVQAAASSRVRRLDRWTLFCCAVALVVGIPVFVVLGAVFVPTGAIWAHLAATVLPRYLSGSLQLLLGVGTGTLLIGVATTWLVTMYSFPGRRILESALLLPLAVPAYVIAYAYTGLLDAGGPVQAWLRGRHPSRWSCRRSGRSAVRSPC